MTTYTERRENKNQMNIKLFLSKTVYDRFVVVGLFSSSFRIVKSIFFGLLHRNFLAEDSFEGKFDDRHTCDITLSSIKMKLPFLMLEKGHAESF